MAKFNTTKTNADHYNVQKRRREAFMKSQAERGFGEVIKGSDVVMHETARGFRTGVYVGQDGDRPSLTMDARKHEIDPGVASTIHRHSWDAIVFVLEGSGWTEIDGVRYDWKAWDSLHLPAWAWHRHGNDGTKTATLVTVSCEPLLDALGLGVLEDPGHGDWSRITLGGFDHAAGEPGNDPYMRRVRRLAAGATADRTRTLHTAYDDVELLPTRRGSMTTFLIDEALGYRTSGLTAAMKVYAPSEGESMHAHPGEAWLLAVEGEGYSYMGAEPEGGEDVEWEAGDLICVHQFCWHGHNNRSDEKLARVVRMHMEQTVGSIQRAVAIPLELKQEPAWVFDRVKDPTTLEWPDEERPD